MHPTQPPAPSKSLGNRCPSPAKKETGNLGVLRKKRTALDCSFNSLGKPYYKSVLMNNIYIYIYEYHYSFWMVVSTVWLKSKSIYRGINFTTGSCKCSLKAILGELDCYFSVTHWYWITTNHRYGTWIYDDLCIYIYMYTAWTIQLGMGKQHLDTFTTTNYVVVLESQTQKASG